MLLPSKPCHVFGPWSGWRSIGKARECSPQKSGSKTWRSYAAMTPTCRASCGSMPPSGPMDSAPWQTRGRWATPIATCRYASPELWMVVPRFTGTTFQGCLIGMLRLQPFLTYIATTVVEDFAVVVLEGEEPIYARHQTTPQYRDTLRQEVAITLPGLTWRVWIWPTVGAILADKLSRSPLQCSSWAS